MQKLIQHRFIRFLFAGCSMAVVQVGIVYIMVSVLHIYYLVSSLTALTIMIFVSFYTHRHWTFQTQKNGLDKQFKQYLFLVCFNYIANSLLMILLVEYFGIHPAIAQFFVTGILAINNFFFYKYIIF